MKLDLASYNFFEQWTPLLLSFHKKLIQIGHKEFIQKSKNQHKNQEKENLSWKDERHGGFAKLILDPKCVDKAWIYNTLHV